MIPFLKACTTWSTMELGLIKIAVGTAYLIMGTLFHDFFDDYLVVISIVFIITAIITFYLWLKKIKYVQD